MGIQAWKECSLRQLPPEAQGIKIEGIYGSFSTLLLLRIPVVIWDLLPRNSAYSFVGFVSSKNLAIARPCQSPLSVNHSNEIGLEPSPPHPQVLIATKVASNRKYRPKLTRTHKSNQSKVTANRSLEVKNKGQITCKPCEHAPPLKIYLHSDTTP